MEHCDTTVKQWDTILEHCYTRVDLYDTTQEHCDTILEHFDTIVEVLTEQWNTVPKYWSTVTPQ